MADLILPASTDVVEHNTKILTLWGNEATKHNFKASLMVSVSQDEKMQLHTVGQMHPAKLAAVLQSMAADLLSSNQTNEATNPQA